MALYKLHDYYPNYRETFGDGKLATVENYSVYTQGEDKVGDAKNLLVDDSGRFRYVVVDTGPWIFGKNVLLPVGLAKFDYNRDRIFVDGLTRQQIENLPAYKDDQAVDQRYEDQVRDQYRSLGKRRNQQKFMDRPHSAETQSRKYDSTSYDREPTLYGMSEEDNHGTLKLYEERLVTNRNRVKTGEVAIGKHVETETAEASVPLEKERVVVERHSTNGKPVGSHSPQFKEGEVARMDVYEDEATIEKEAYAREEVSVRKETERDVAKAKETVRREELDVNTDGKVRVER